MLFLGYLSFSVHFCCMLLFCCICIFVSKWDAFFVLVLVLDVDIFVSIQKLIRMFCDCFRILLIDSSFFRIPVLSNNMCIALMVARNFCLFLLFLVAYTEYNIIHLISERLSDSIVCFTIIWLYCYFLYKCFHVCLMYVFASIYGFLYVFLSFFLNQWFFVLNSPIDSCRFKLNWLISIPKSRSMCIQIETFYFNRFNVVCSTCWLYYVFIRV